MVRISDARMSGTAYGTVVLHTAPEAAAGGPLALVQNGDMIELDVPKRRLHLDVSDAELARRRARLEAAEAAAATRLLEALRRPRAAGRRGRGPRLPGGQARGLRAAGQSLKGPLHESRHRHRRRQRHRPGHRARAARRRAIASCSPAAARERAASRPRRWPARRPPTRSPCRPTWPTRRRSTALFDDGRATLRPPRPAVQQRRHRRAGRCRSRT